MTAPKGYGDLVSENEAHNAAEAAEVDLRIKALEQAVILTTRLTPFKDPADEALDRARKFEAYLRGGSQ